ncbi:MAG: hypothetical protein EHM58_08190 [Ignavibacteriae bacterium]|nr:MAG: hypothetical protein EHM58_08190 [Ignavibacteriota bacterium]
MNSIKAITLIMLVFSLSFIYAQRSGDKGERWDTDNVLTLTGTITDVNRPLSTFSADDGTVYQIHMGPFWYWEDNKYELKKDTKAVIKAEVKGNDIYPWEIEQDGNKMYFADENGVPKWSNGNGKGWKNGKGFNGNGKGKCWK